MIIIIVLLKYRTKIIIMQDDYNQQFTKNRATLINAVSKVLQEQINGTNKSIKLFSREYEFSDGLISKLIRGKYSDIKLSTVWKFANALNINPATFINMINENLPDDFNFYD